MIIYSLQWSSRDENRLEFFRSLADRASRRAELNRYFKRRPFEQFTVDSQTTHDFSPTKPNLVALLGWAADRGEPWKPREKN